MNDKSIRILSVSVNETNVFVYKIKNEKASSCNPYKPGVHNLLALSLFLGITPPVSPEKLFFALLLFCFLMSVQMSLCYAHTVDKEFLLIHGCHNTYFEFHVHGRIHFWAVRPQVVNTCCTRFITYDSMQTFRFR